MRCVLLMLEQSDNTSLGKGLSILADALYEKSNSKMTDAANLFEIVCDHGNVSNLTEPILRAFSAFAFEASGESPRSKRSYNKLYDMILPLEEALGSKELSKIYTQTIAHYGLRSLDGFGILSKRLFRELSERQTHPHFIPEVSLKPDYLISLGIIDLLLKYSEALERKRKWTLLATEIESLYGTVQCETVSPWLAILARLVCYMLNSIAERSILNLGLPKHLETRLVKNRITELWIPQAEAVRKGLLRGTNMVYSTGTATGKSLLAYLLSGTASVDQKVIYIVPTRTLADEAYKTIAEFIDPSLNQIAVTTREKTEFDEKLSQYAIIVATYEKFDSLLKQKRLNDANLKCLIADEVHYISDRFRGIPLEFTLAEIKNRTGADDPQIVALSAMINSEDANQMSSWLHASLVRQEWKPIVLDEVIFYDGKLYHKNGRVEEVHPPIKLPSKDELKIGQRMAIITRLIRNSILKRDQCMVVVNSRKEAERVAEGISNYLNVSRYFDVDSKKQLSLNDVERQKLRLEIQNSEPELPACGQKLFRFMNNGVAYHHGGLPSKYREIIENGVKKQLVNVLVTTTTFEAGVNLPISTVIFLDVSRGEVAMPVRRYRNLAGRAGRPQFDVKGESIIITLTKEEFDKVQNLYFLSEEEPLESSIRYFMRNQPRARYAIQSEILYRILKYDVLDFKRIMDFMSQSWFWVRADEPTREQFRKQIRTELRKLGIFGFVETSGNLLKLTDSGKVAGRTMLNPLSIRNLLDNAKKIFAGNFDTKSLVILLLSLAGIPSEVEDGDEIIKRVKVASECEFVSKVLGQDPKLYEKYERIQVCPQYATVLWYWVNDLPTEKILELCRLDTSADAALLEELLPNNAYWVLATLASIPDSALKMTEEQRDLVTDLATRCRLGSSDPIAQELLNLGLKHIGRNTAIKIARHLIEMDKPLTQITESELCELFSENQDSAKLLFRELEEKGMFNDTG